MTNKKDAYIKCFFSFSWSIANTKVHKCSHHITTKVPYLQSYINIQYTKVKAQINQF